MQSGYTNAPLHSLYKYSKWHPVFVLANNAVRKQKVAQRFYILFALLSSVHPPTRSRIYRQRTFNQLKFDTEN